MKVYPGFSAHSVLFMKLYVRNQALVLTQALKFATDAAHAEHQVMTGDVAQDVQQDLVGEVGDGDEGLTDALRRAMSLEEQKDKPGLRGVITIKVNTLTSL